MDYKYIEQLLERYWEGQTSLQEESILRSFYSQLASMEPAVLSDIPESIKRYLPLFTMERETPLGDDFDEKVLQLTEGNNPQQGRSHRGHPAHSGQCCPSTLELRLGRSERRICQVPQTTD